MPGAENLPRPASVFPEIFNPCLPAAVGGQIPGSLPGKPQTLIFAAALHLHIPSASAYDGNAHAQIIEPC